MGRNWNEYLLYLAGILLAAAYGNVYCFLLDTRSQFLIFYIIIMLPECTRPGMLLHVCSMTNGYFFQHFFSLPPSHFHFKNIHVYLSQR